MPRFSLRLKLLAGVLLLLLPVFGLLLWSFRVDYERRREMALDRQVRIAETTAALVDTVFDDAIDLGWALANDPVIRSLDPSLVDPHLQRLAPRYPQYLDVEVFNPQGESVGASIPYAPGERRISIAATPHFQQVMATGQPVVTEVRQAFRFGGRPIVVIDVPVRENGRATGTINLLLDAAHLPARLADVRLRPGDGIAVIDPVGRLAFHNLRPDLSWEERDVSGQPEVAAALAGETIRTDTFRSSFLDDVQAAGFVRSPRHGWVVAVCSPAATVFAPVESAFRRQLAVFLGIALAGLAGAWILSGYLINPLGRLASLARALGCGEIGRRVAVRTGDELQDLAETINAMAAQLDERQAEVARLRAEAEQRARQLAAVIVSMTDAVFIASADGWLADANPAALRLMGMADREELGRPLAEYLQRYDLRLRDGRPLMPEELPPCRAMAGETFSDVELRFRTLDGEERWASVSGAPVRDEAGRIVLGVVVARDVTEQRRAEEALKRERDFIAAIVESTDDAIVGATRDGTIVSWNTSAERLFGYSAEEVRGRPVAILAPPDRPHEVRELLGRVARGERVDHFETVRVRKDGRRVDVSLSIAPLRDATQAVVGVAGIVRDITERKRAEEERARLFARERALAEIGRALVSELELARVAEVVIEQSLKVLRSDTAGLWLANPAHRELVLLAYRHAAPATAEALGRVSYDAPFLTARAARTEQIQVIEDLAAVDAPPSTRQIYEREGVRSLVAVPLRSRGRLVGVVTHLTRTPRQFSPSDVEFNTTVADLFAVAIENARLYEEVRQALRLREEFIAAAAHELKTPVTAIKGWTEVLLRSDGRERHEQRALETIARQSARITRLVEDLLAVARLRPGPPELRRERFDLSALAEELVRQTASTTEHHHLSVGTAGPLVVEADRQLIGEVLGRLLENAVRYTPAGGSIVVATRRADGEAVVSVTDQGVGIPPERQPHVFEPFYEAVPGGSPGYVGLITLGLHLSKQLVEAHGGRIWFASTPGQGSTFSFSLPLAAA